MNGLDAMNFQWTEEANKKWHDVIDSPTPEDKIKLRPTSYGKSLRYVAPAYVIDLLNRAFEKWSFEILTSECEKVPGKEEYFYCVLGRLTVAGLGSREQYGAKAIQSRDNLDTIAEARKAAATDSMKKCASMFGIALDLYEDAIESTNTQRTQPTNNYRQAQPTNTYRQNTAATTPTQPKPEQKQETNDWDEDNIKKYDAQLKELAGVWKDLGLKTNQDRTPFVAAFLDNKDASWPRDIRPSNIKGFVEHMKSVKAQ